MAKYIKEGENVLAWITNPEGTDDPEWPTLQEVNAAAQQEFPESRLDQIQVQGGLSAEGWRVALMRRSEEKTVAH